MNEYLLLIDGSSLLSTQYYGNLPREILFEKNEEERKKYYHKIMMTSKGVYTNAVYGFLRTLFRILKEQQPSHLAIAWDTTRDTFRRRLYPAYKGTRSETPEPLIAQFTLCRDIMKELGIAQFSDPEYEADDFCGSLAARFENEIPVRIFTKDHDYLQLVNDRTHMWLMHTSAEKTEEMYRKYHLDHSKMNVPDRAFELTPDLVLQEFGVLPENVNSLKGLEGDSSDNIRGVSGVGHQTAAALIRKYGNVDALYREIHEREAIPGGLDTLKNEWKEELGITRSPLNFLLKTSDTELAGEASARLSEKLATILRDLDLGALQLSDLALHIHPEDAARVLKELEISSIRIDFLEEAKEEKDVLAAAREIGTFEEAEALLQKLIKEPAAGAHYVPECGVSFAAGEELVFIPERMFITAETIAEMIRRLKAAGVRLYSIEGKPIVKLSGVGTEDLSIAAYLLDPLPSEYPYQLIAGQYAGIELKDRMAILGKLSPKEALDEQEDALVRYMCAVALAAYVSAPKLLEKLESEEMGDLYREIELPLMELLARMEESGIRIERSALQAYDKELLEEIRRLEEEIYDLAGERFNINSPKQLGTILFEKLGLPAPKKTKTGYSTSAEVLERLQDVHPLVGKVLEYRTYAKLHSTYAEGLQGFIREDGRIHSDFNQTVTATGRLSSANPNLQNIPVRMELGRKIRRVFVPEDGCIFVDADYSQIELRVLAHLSGDENLIAAYKEARDIHAITASQVFHVPLEEMTPDLRRKAKAVNFGIVYGISAFSLSEDLDVSRKEAEAYMRSYFAAYPKIEAFLKRLVDDAREKGYAETLFKRRRPIPELFSSNFNQRSFGERVAMNSPIQGTAADIMKIAMIRVDRRLREAGLKTRIVLQIHDELVLEAPLSEADRAEEILVYEMEHAALLSVMLKAEAKRGFSLYETK